jgi:ANTAR domain
MVELAVKIVEGSRYATISELRGRQSHLLAASDQIGARLEQLQNELAEGPTLAAARLEQDIVIPDLIRESRWRRFAELAVRATDARSVLAFRLAGPHPSVLTIYGADAGFSDEAMHAATIFASQAATLVALMAAEDHSANLETALQSSREIGIALGILMAHRKVTHEHAFDLLRTASQNLHRKLRDVASEVMETGTLPDLPPRRE